METQAKSSQVAQTEAPGANIPDVPIPLSFPALLRNPGLSDRYAHLQSQGRHHVPTIVKKTRNRSNENEGKRWIRRKDNAQFVGNPHIVIATKKDYALTLTRMRSTFPEPLPAYLPRTAEIPAVTPPTFDPNSANAGRFSLSLKGMRRELRRSGFRAEALVRDIETEILEWLLEGGTILSPDLGNETAFLFPGMAVRDTQTISEVSRTPLQLVWSIADDAFARYVVHCCARYHEIISFSKEISGQRLTYLLRPNVTRPDYHATAILDTPPVTDIEHSSQFDTDSDLLSDLDSRSGAEESDVEPHLTRPSPLSAISEDSLLPSSPRHPKLDPTFDNDDAWSVIGDTDAESEGGGGDVLAASIESLSIDDPDQTLQAEPHIRPSPLRSRLWDHRHGRSASSPSRSPARRQPRRALHAEAPHSRRPKSFYDYLFA